MTELEWLKQESGLTDEEIKGFEAVGGFTKLRSGLMKVLGLSEQALKDKVAAEQARIDLENRYQNEMIPELKRTATESIQAQGELARVRAELAKAQEYGIVPESVKPPSEPPRAPGSPAPASPAFDDKAFAQRQSKAIIAVQDLSAEHFKLFGAPLSGTQELVDMVDREHTLGHKDFSLQKAWEQKFNVPEKRAEIQKAERQKEIDAAIAADRKVQAEKHGSNPNVRSGQPSRFSNYKPTDAAGNKEPWKASHSSNERNRPWREKAVAKVREAMAS
jgi:hypothetical protein